MAIPKHIKDNISIPVIGAPLFLVSGPDLVIAQCKAGIIGSFPALNARPQHVLEEWIIRIKKELAEYQEQNPDAKVAPFAVNQICHASNDRLMQDIETCVNQEFPIIITNEINDGSNIDFLPPINIDIKEKINSQEYRDEVYRLIKQMDENFIPYEITGADGSREVSQKVYQKNNL